MQALQTIIDNAFENRASLSPSSAPVEIRDAVEEVIAGLDAGTLRVAEKKDGHWVLNQWIKKAVLISFRLRENEQVQAGGLNFFDKVDTKFGDYTPEQFREGGFRVVPPAVARKGSFIGRNVVLMPSYVNIGAYVDEGTMVDTWATVGSCAQIGMNVHLSGGVGIGGMLEPIQAGPVIIEENAVLSMGVYIGQSTKIYDRETGTVSYGRVPSGAVVVPGSLPSACGKYSLYCAVIVKRVDAQTRAKTGINELLRNA